MRWFWHHKANEPLRVSGFVNGIIGYLFGDSVPLENSNRPDVMGLCIAKIHLMCDTLTVTQN